MIRSSFGSGVLVQTNQCQEFLGVPSEHNATNMYVLLVTGMGYRGLGTTRAFERFLLSIRNGSADFGLDDSFSLDGIRNVCGFASALIGNVANSQSSAGISYTYTGEESLTEPSILN